MAKCPRCKAFEPHVHQERIDRPNLKPDTWYFGCATGDLYWAPREVLEAIINVIRVNPDTTVMLQSKAPATFSRVVGYPDNVILGTTVETNRNKPDLIHSYKRISKAPLPAERVLSLKQINHSRKYVALEPLFFFDKEAIIDMLGKIDGLEIIYYGIGNHEEDLGITLPTPNPDRVRELGKILEQSFPEATVIPKTIETPGKFRVDEEEYAMVESMMESIARTESEQP